MQLTHISNAVQLILSVLLHTIKFATYHRPELFFRGLQVSGTILQPCVGTDD
jgi:hypothetical protein